jgi:starch-binding outer membrane protein, SusD/RagB family
MYKISLLRTLMVACCLFIFSCKKFVEVDAPRTSLVASTIFTKDASAMAVLTSVYSRMMEGGINLSSGSRSIGLLCGLSADELENFATRIDQVQFATNNLESTNQYLTAIWSELYKYIYVANTVLEQLKENNAISPRFNQQMTGEALFIRAFCYYYLTALFGDVPLILTTDYQQAAVATRLPGTEVIKRIIVDLKASGDLLQEQFVDQDLNNSEERIRPNKWAAAALLARVYLLNGEWENAENQATLVIEQTALFSLETDLNKTFIKNSRETIWQLMPVFPGYNTLDGNTYILTSLPTSVALSPHLMVEFEPQDRRRTDWVKDTAILGRIYSFPYKYKVKTNPVVSEYQMVLRLAEQYLIRAEARANLHRIVGFQSATTDLNALRNRAGLPDVINLDESTVGQAIEHERKVELFTEWGHRWIDLKRTHRSDAILSPLKPAWKSTDSLYPIPQSERTKDPNLTQNAGY